MKAACTARKHSKEICSVIINISINEKVILFKSYAEITKEIINNIKYNLKNKENSEDIKSARAA
jgi:hypothetical protein